MGQGQRRHLVYNKFLNIWEKNINVIQELSCTFMLPSIPKSTFRDSNNIYNSCLYDIGCYPISLLVDLNVDLINLKINNFKFSNGKLNYIEIKNVLGKTVYTNRLKVKKGKNLIPFSKGDLRSGMYIYAIQNNKELVSKRFVIK